jgi:uncharacterized membrane protein
MSIPRTARHLLVTRRQVQRAFPRPTLLAIEQAIKESETAHVGEIRFAVEGALDGMPLLKGQSARDRAIDVFSQLRVWDTEHNNGVLIYLLLADRHVEIVADRGVHARVGSQEWETICRQMEAAFRRGHYQQGVVGGIQAVTQHLAKHFPASGDRRNDLADKPVLL